MSLLAKAKTLSEPFREKGPSIGNAVTAAYWIGIVARVLEIGIVFIPVSLFEKRKKVLDGYHHHIHT